MWLTKLILSIIICIFQGDDSKPVAFIERFLERIAVSEYIDKFILKGGMLAVSLLGIDMRATMDVDTMVKAMLLTVDDISRIVGEICAIDVSDNVTFEIKSLGSIELE